MSKIKLLFFTTLLFIAGPAIAQKTDYAKKGSDNTFTGVNTFDDAVINKSVSLDGDSDNFDVSSSNIVLVDSTLGNIVIGGLSGGTLGQVVTIIKAADGNTVTVEDNEGSGAQKFLTVDGTDIVLTDRGGVTAIFDGTYWLVTNEGQVAGVDFVSPWSESNILYVGKHGSDSNDGSTMSEAFLTFGAAITSAIAKGLSSSNRYTIFCIDGGNYTEDFVVPQWVYIHAQVATLIGRYSLTDVCVMDVGKLSGSHSSYLVTKLGASSSARASLLAQNIEYTGTGNGVLLYYGGLDVDIKRLTVGSTSGTPVGVTITNGPWNLTGSLGKLTLNSDNAVGISVGYASSSLNLTVGSISENGTPATTTAIAVSNGTANITCSSTSADTAVNISGGELNLIGGSIVGTITKTGGTYHYMTTSTGADLAGRIIGDSFTARGTGTDPEPANCALYAYDTVDDYYQINVQNQSDGVNASSDFVATADTGDDDTNYIDMGINSSGYFDVGWTINGPLDGYLYSSDGELAVGTKANESFKIFTGGTLAANKRIEVTGAGSIYLDAFTGLLKGTSGLVSAATAGVDYASVASGTAGQATYFSGTGAVAGETGYLWDATNDRLTVGTSATAAPAITMRSSTGTISFDGAGGTQFHDRLANGAQFVGRRANGTLGSPTQALLNDSLVVFAGRGYGITDYNVNNTASILMLAAQNHTDSAAGTYMSFYTTPNDTIVPVAGMSLLSTGYLKLNFLATSTSDSVITENAGTLEKRAIDTRAWGSSLVDGAGSAGRMAYWTDTDTLASEAAFLYDSTTNKITLGGTSETASSFESIADVGTVKWDAAANASLILERYGSNAQIFGQRAQGTRASPTAVTNNTTLVSFGGRGWYDTTGFSASTMGYMGVYASNTWTASSMGSHLRFVTTPIGTITPTEAVRIIDTGNVGIGTTAPYDALSVTRALNTTTVGNGVVLAIDSGYANSYKTEIGFGTTANGTYYGAVMGYSADTGNNQNTAGDLYFATAATPETSVVEHLRITENGYFGFNTTTPYSAGSSTSVHISGPIDNTYSIVTLQRNDTTVADTNVYSTLQWYSNDSDHTSGNIAAKIDAVAYGAQSGVYPSSRLIFYTAGGATGLVEAFKITSTQQTLFAKSANFTPTAHGSMGATETFDLSAGQFQTGTLDSNCTITWGAPSGAGVWTYEITQNATGGYTFTWPAGTRYADGIAPVICTVANCVTDLTVVYNGSAYTVGVAFYDVKTP